MSNESGPEMIWALPPAWRSEPVTGSWFGAVPKDAEGFNANNPVAYRRADLVNAEIDRITRERDEAKEQSSAP